MLSCEVINATVLAILHHLFSMDIMDYKGKSSVCTNPDGFVHRFPARISDAFDGDNDNTYLSTCPERDASQLKTYYVNWHELG